MSTAAAPKVILTPNSGTGIAPSNAPSGIQLFCTTTLAPSLSSNPCAPQFITTL